MSTPRPRIGLNAHLLALDESYRGAGVSRYIHNLLLHLPEVDAGADYLAFVGDARAHFAGWRTRRSLWPTARPAARIAWEQTAQPWRVWREGLDLLHLPVYVGPLLATCPQVVTIHDLSFFLYPQFFRPFQRAYLQTLTRRTAQRAAAVIADSASTRADIVRVLGVDERKISVIPVGVGADMCPCPAEAVAALRQRRGLPEPMILFVGTLEPRKNVPLLLEAFARLRRTRALPHRLVIAGGKGWYYEEIYATAARLGLGEEVIFPGYVPQDELALWYNAADLFVYPSLYEGFGLPPLEAMACGTPVIVSAASSLPEVVGEAGVIVDARDPQALAVAMGTLLEDRAQHRARREAGLARAQAFSWAATAQRTAAVYHQVLGR
jgi:glycosyltransferase involved in cell wall biosynthesis